MKWKDLKDDTECLIKLELFVSTDCTKFARHDQIDSNLETVSIETFCERSTGMSL